MREPAFASPPAATRGFALGGRAVRSQAKKKGLASREGARPLPSSTRPRVGASAQRGGLAKQEVSSGVRVQPQAPLAWRSQRAER